MLALVMNSLFPETTPQDITLTKKLLSQYKKMRAVVDDFERNQGHQHQQRVYVQAKAAVTNIERAINLIIDEEVRRIIEYRYLKGHKYKVTVLHFNSIMADRTVDRKLIEGIEAVANTLKLWGELM